jgi:class 3 adenylate cyclase/predicted ATPase
MRCSNCQAANPRRARFCLHCGLALPPPGNGRASTTAWAEAERRQLTCLFCDLRNSVDLSERTDPEELRDILAAYQQLCLSVIRRFEGHIARFFGDGILVYFGFPKAHEDEARRAVRSGLGICEALGQLNIRLEREHGVRLQVRIGVHTGLVVAGDIAPDQDLETMAAIGETPNIAARLQALAEPDTVVVSAATYRLIAGYFDARELGFHALRGISQPVAIYQVLNESGARTRLDVAAARGLPPMLGRDSELSVLRDLWQRVHGSAGQAVLITGEPGIGKSRLIWALQTHVAQAANAALVKLTCSPLSQNTAFYPVIESLERTLEFAAGDTVAQRLDKLDGFLAQYGFAPAEFVPLLADLLSLPVEDRYQSPDLSAERRRRLLMDALVRIVLLRAEHQPVLYIVEDLHWADPSTLDLLAELLNRLAPARLLAVFSSRPEFHHAWPESVHVELLALGRLTPDISEAIVSEVAGKPLPGELLQQLLGKADGVPLYLEELTKLVMEAGLLRDQSDRFELARPLPELSIPASLADSLTARLDRQSSAKRVAQVGATIGRQFSFELLVSVLRGFGSVREAQVRRDLARLVEAELLLVDSGTRRAVYTFKHALIQDAAYESLLRSTRQQVHRRIAELLSERSPTSSDIGPELVALHYCRAGLLAESLPWWLRAGRRALSGSAYREAIAHLNTGLELLGQMPPSLERTQGELEFRLAVGPAYMATRGYGAVEVEGCYQQARQLCRDLGDPPQLAPVLYGLWTYHIVRAQHWTALELGEQILQLGTATADDALLVQGHLAVGWSQFFLGRLSAAREHLEAVLALYTEERHGSHLYTFGDNPATSAGSCLAQVYWLLGFPDRAQQTSDQTVARLRSVTHPYTIAFGFDVLAFVRINLGDPSATRALVEEATALSVEWGLALTASMGTILHGYAATLEGDLEQGISEMREGLGSYVRTGAELAMPFWNWALAEACRRADARPDALAFLKRAEEMRERTDESYWHSEIYRLRGLLQVDAADTRAGVAAEQSYLRALELATNAGARSLELRSAVALARLWQSKGLPGQGHDLLARIYNWFTEGLATRDLHEARELLDSLASARPSVGGGMARSI